MLGVSTKVVFYVNIKKEKIASPKQTFFFLILIIPKLHSLCLMVDIHGGLMSIVILIVDE
jgi:hypothetical protein